MAVLGSIGNVEEDVTVFRCQVAPTTAFGLLAGIQHYGAIYLSGTARFWETSITGVREFPATRINGVGMDAEVIGDAAAQGSEVKGARPLRSRPLRVAIDVSNSTEN